MADAAVTEPAKLKVFISYSRKDEDFAQEFLAGLEWAGIERYLDKHDIAAGEDWEARLGCLIEAADTVVFVISPDAVASQRCAWEVERTEEAAASDRLPTRRGGRGSTTPEADNRNTLRNRRFYIMSSSRWRRMPKPRGLQPSDNGLRKWRSHSNERRPHRKNERRPSTGKGSRYAEDDEHLLAWPGFSFASSSARSVGTISIS